jgi:hypothetical protein
MVKAKDVLNSEMLRLRGRVKVQSTTDHAKALRAQARLEQAKRRFPGLSDWEALEALRDWEIDHQ